MNAVEELQKDLEERGVRFFIGAYVDGLGVPKSKIVPLKVLGRAAADSELYAVGALDHLRYEFPYARFRQCGNCEISPPVADIYCRDGRDVHANRAETSLLLPAFPGMVRPEWAFDVPDVTTDRVWSYDMPRTTRTGVVGRPTGSTAEDGAIMSSSLVTEFEVLPRAALAEDWPEIP